MSPDITIVIPSFKSKELLPKLLQAICNQSLQPKEVLIINSSDEDLIKSICNSFLRKINIRLINTEKCFPGKARNIGVRLATTKLVAFLDTKTIPKKQWLEISLQELNSKKAYICFGSTKYVPTTYFQKILCMCTFGKKSVQTTPGSLMERTFILKHGKFIENVRASEDLEWRERIKRSTNKWVGTSSITSYFAISKSLAQEMVRQFIYQIHSAKTETQINTKVILLGFFIFFLAILIPQWNSIVGWEESPLYAPYITRGFMIFIIFLLYILLSINRLVRFRNLLVKFLILSFTSIVLYIVYTWNRVYAGWSEESFFYIPNITKLYLVFLFMSCFIFRGIYIPLTRGYEIKEIFPLHFIFAGLIGVVLDIIKLPGYLFGAFLALLRR